MLVSANFDDSIDRTALLSDIESIIEENPDSKTYSNSGGYHSPGYWLSDGYRSDKPTLDLLGETALKFLHGELNHMEWRFGEIKTYYWFMKNHLNNYNHIHMHAVTDFVGVYYADVPEDSGSMNIVRNDGISYSNLFSDNNQVNFRLTPVAGRFYLMPGHLWHYVSESNSLDSRISIAFNFAQVPYFPD